MESCKDFWGDSRWKTTGLQKIACKEVSINTNESLSPPSLASANPSLCTGEAGMIPALFPPSSLVLALGHKN